MKAAWFGAQRVLRKCRKGTRGVRSKSYESADGERASAFRAGICRGAQRSLLPPGGHSTSDRAWLSLARKHLSQLTWVPRLFSGPPFGPLDPLT